jgi:cytochrome c
MAVLALAGGLVQLGWLTGPLAAADQTLRGHGGPVKAVVVSTDGDRVLTGSFDYSMGLWGVAADAAPALVQRVWDHDGAVNAVRFVPGRAQAISASDDGRVALWDLQSGKLVKRFEGHTHKVVAVDVSRDGKVAASAAWDRSVRIWNLADLKAGPVLEGHRNTVNAVALTSDGGKVFSAGYNGEIRQWDVRSGELDRVVYKHGWGVNVIALLAGEGQLLFGALNGSVGVLDLASGNVVRMLERHERPVLAVATALEHGVVATGGGDGLIQVWDTASWQVKFRHEHSFGPVWALDFSGDGKAVYFAGLDDHVAYWQMVPDKPFEVAESKLPRPFQKREGLGPGELQFARKCSICHSLGADHKNRAGPSLIGVFGRRAGTVPGYSYSRTLKESDIVWDAGTIERLFAEGPETFVPGSKMPLQKMTERGERLALIDYLKRATEVAGQRQGETQ